MKIAVLGYSGSGKSTLARALGRRYGVNVLHLDAVQFLPGWQIRTAEEQLALTKTFMDENDGWVIDGNYSNLLQQRRLAEADEIVLLLFSRWACLGRVRRRYRKHAGRTRPDMTEGCSEKLDREFLVWILWRGRTPRRRRRWREILSEYGDKTTVLKNQRQLDLYYKEKGLAPPG